MRSGRSALFVVGHRLQTMTHELRSADPHADLGVALEELALDPAAVPGEEPLLVAIGDEDVPVVGLVIARARERVDDVAHDSSPTHASSF